MANVDGTSQDIILGGSSTESVWSPDGTKIAVVRDKEIYVMNADGTGQTRLTTNTANDGSLTWGSTTASITVTPINSNEIWQVGTKHSLTGPRMDLLERMSNWISIGMKIPGIIICIP